MHIGMVTDTYFPRMNGVAKSIATFTEQFRRLGHRVTIFAPQFPEARESEPELWRFPSHYLFFSPEDRMPNLWLPESRRLLRQIASLRLDIIHTQTPFTLGFTLARLARRLGLPCLHTYHTLFEAYLPHYFKLLPRAWDRPLVKWFSRTFCKLHDQVVVPSSPVQERLRAYGLKPPIKILPTGINLEPFRNVDGARMRKKLGFKPQDKLLLTMGRVAGEKNLPFLFEVLEKLSATQPRARLVIAGQGPALGAVKQECRQRKLKSKVVFIGLLNTRDWADLYAAADLQLLASVTETQGLVLTEAMAAGTPCVAVLAMGVRDVLAGGGGLGVAQDVNEFAQAVNRLLSDKKMYAKKLSEAKRQAQDWSAESKAAEMIGNYQQLIRAKKSGPKRRL